MSQLLNPVRMVSDRGGGLGAETSARVPGMKQTASRSCCCSARLPSGAKSYFRNPTTRQGETAINPSIEIWEWPRQAESTSRNEEASS